MRSCLVTLVMSGLVMRAAKWKGSALEPEYTVHRITERSLFSIEGKGLYGAL